MSAGLTSFRFLAFFAVFLFHKPGDQLEMGYLGVQAFFVLSGFLLTPIILCMKKDLPASRFFLNFYGRRFLRLFPLYYTYVIFVAFLCWAFLKWVGPQANFSNYLEVVPWLLTYLFNFYHASDVYVPGVMYSHFWSLAVEEQFYLLWPLVLFFLDRGNVKTFLVVMILLGPLFRLGALYLHSHANFGFVEGPDLFVYILPTSHLDAFAFGGFFALYVGKQSNRCLLGLCLAVFAYGVAIRTLVLGESGVFPIFPRFMMGDPIFGLTFLNALFAFVISQIRYGLLFRSMLELKPMVYLGSISYGLYVYHYPMFLVVGLTVPASLGLETRTVIAFLLTVLVSSISYFLIEKRFIDLKGRLFPKQRQPG